jgi:dGTPase
MVALSAAMARADEAIKGFLYPRMYRHERIARIMTDAQSVVADLFGRYLASPAELPVEWHLQLASEEGARARQVGDFIAGMTDRFALIEHARLFDSTPELR